MSSVPALPHDHGQNISQVLASLPREEDLADISALFSRLSDPCRLRIFWLLCHCEECVLNISAAVDMSSPAVSYHLKLLRDSGLITSRRSGHEVYYRAADTNAVKLLHEMMEDLLAITCPADHGQDDINVRDDNKRGSSGSCDNKVCGGMSSCGDSAP